MDGEVGAGQEDQAGRDELHDCGGGIGVADERCHCDSQGAKAGRAEYQGHEQGSPLVGERHAVGP